MKLAYLVSRYPAVSHTFITREILALRTLGFEVSTFTIRRPRREELLTPRDREESQRTTAILPVGLMRLIRAHGLMLSHQPLRYLSTLGRALIHRPPGLRAALWQLYYFAEAGVLATELRRQGIVHVHAHFADVAAAVAMLASQMSGHTWSMTLHGLADFGDPSTLSLTEKIHAAAFVICVSQFGRAQAMLRSRPELWEKIHHVHCGIEPDGYKPAIRPTRSAGSQPLRVLSVGRLNPEKGQSVLLHALRHLEDRGIDLSCTLVGDGTERSNLARLAEKLAIRHRVTFAGAVGQDDIQAHYDNADIFVLPSLAEGLPVVLMEAMAKELPVIATHVMGIPELVEHRVNGLLVPPGDPSRLAEAVAVLVRNPELRADMGSRGREKVCSEFDVLRSAEHLAAIFRSVSHTGSEHQAQQRDRTADSTCPIESTS